MLDVSDETHNDFLVALAREPLNRLQGWIREIKCHSRPVMRAAIQQGMKRTVTECNTREATFIRRWSDV